MACLSSTREGRGDPKKKHHTRAFATTGVRSSAAGPVPTTHASSLLAQLARKRRFLANPCGTFDGISPDFFLSNSLQQNEEIPRGSAFPGHAPRPDAPGDQPRSMWVQKAPVHRLFCEKNVRLSGSHLCEHTIKRPPSLDGTHAPAHTPPTTTQHTYTHGVV